jgi:hypothetical protein
MGEDTVTVLPSADGPYDEGDKMKRTVLSMNGATRSLSDSYVRELRRLIREDAYNTIHVLDEVARRMLASRDL